ncbi:MAG: hypothetical protein ABFE13_11490 [Phycisphaerales bacterium]
MDELTVALLDAAKDILLYSREGGPDFTEWDRKFDALRMAVEAMEDK